MTVQPSAQTFQQSLCKDKSNRERDDLLNVIFNKIHTQTQQKPNKVFALLWQRYMLKAMNCSDTIIGKKPGPKGKILEPYAEAIFARYRRGQSMQDIANWLAESPQNVTITRGGVYSWIKARIRKIAERAVELGSSDIGKSHTPLTEDDQLVSEAAGRLTVNGLVGEAGAPSALPHRTDSSFDVTVTSVKKAEAPAPATSPSPASQQLVSVLSNVRGADSYPTPWDPNRPKKVDLSEYMSHNDRSNDADNPFSPRYKSKVRPSR